MKIIFMGSPDFAVPALSTLLKSKHEISLVVTQPDKPVGRGLKIKPCAVADFAIKNNLKLFQPQTIKNSETKNILKNYTPDLIVIVAYGKILTKDVLTIPKYGSVNIHASLLPKYRGAAPINWAIINGEKKTGITLMMINEKLDAGDILLKQEVAISDTDTTKELHDKLALAGADLLIQTLNKLELRKIKRTPQNNNLATYAPLLKKQDGLIIWQKNAKEINNFIRGMQPWPVAFTHLNNKILKIFKAFPVDEVCKQSPGTVIDSNKDLIIATGKGVLYLKEVQIEGKKRIPVKDFLAGHKIEKQTQLK